VQQRLAPLFAITAACHCLTQAQQTAPVAPSFDVASIKPNHTGSRGMMINNRPGGRFVATNISVAMLLRMTYHVQDFQISGGPKWINTERYDIEAIPESAETDNVGKLTADQREVALERQRQRVEQLLESRFDLKLHRETKELPVYVLVVAKNGPKFRETTTADTPGPGQGLRVGRGEAHGQAVRLSQLAEALS
jgi:bla regulator protein blaR1